MSEMRRRVAFTAFDVDEDKYTFMSVSCGSLLASLQAHVDWGYSSPTNDPKQIGPSFAANYAKGILSGASPSAFGDIDLLFGVYVWNDALTCRVLRLLREGGLKNRIILGGPQITWTPAGRLEDLYPEADLFIRGEGEEALIQVTRSTNPVSLAGVHYAGQLDDCSRAKADLTKLPSPLLEPTAVIPVDRVKKVRWETKRGCSFSCHFCQHRGAGSRPRCFTTDRLVEEMRWFLEKDIRLLTVVDPIFNTGQTYMWVLSELNQMGYDGKLSLQCRFECVEDAFLDMVCNFDVCLEFGLQSIHEEECRAIGRPNGMDKVQSVMEKLNDLGIHYEVDLMYGLPGQTVDSFCRSIAFCHKNKVPRIRTWPLMLLRGTKLDEKEGREKWEFRENEDTIPLVVACKSFSEKDWLEMKQISDTLAS